MTAEIQFHPGERITHHEYGQGVVLDPARDAAKIRAFFVAPRVHEPEVHMSSADGQFGDESHHGHHHHADHGEAPWPIVVALCCTAAATIAFFFYSDLAVSLATQIRRGLP